MITWDGKEWCAKLADGTVIRSPSKSELEAFLDMLENRS